MVKIVIPARKGSKGLPGKNRKLFNSTAQTIPAHNRSCVYVTTDDEIIMQLADGIGFNVIERPAELATDESCTKDVLLHAINSEAFLDNEIVVMLYLTYPERTWEDVEKCFDYFVRHNAASMLCREEPRSNPYLCMIENGEHGQQIVPHNYYRRQDYPKTFEISHYVFIAYCNEIKKLNNNLYNYKTYFCPIDRVHDIDTEKDMTEYEKSSCNAVR